MNEGNEGGGQHIDSTTVSIVQVEVGRSFPVLTHIVDASQNESSKDKVTSSQKHWIFYYKQEYGYDVDPNDFPYESITHDMIGKFGTYNLATRHAFAYMNEMKSPCPAVPYYCLMLYVSNEVLFPDLVSR